MPISIVRAGNEAIVNAYVTNAQTAPRLTALTGGGYVAVWVSDGQDGSSLGVFGQRFNAVGQRVGPEFQVNTTTAGFQNVPEVASLDNGGFVVTWRNHDFYGTGADDIRAQRFLADATRVGPEIIANTYTTGDQLNPDVTGLTGGGFFVTWTAQNPGVGTNEDVYGQVFNNSGAMVGPERLVNGNYINSFQGMAQVVTLADGTMAAAYLEGNALNSYNTVRVQRLNADGTTNGAMVGFGAGLGPAFPSLTNVQLAALTGGNLVVTYQTSSAGGRNVWSQIVDPINAATVGDPFVVNATSNGAYALPSPSVTALTDGTFVIVWTRYGGATDTDYGIYAQRFDATGTRIGSEFLVNTTTAGNQEEPTVTALPGGAFAIAWAADGQDGDGWTIVQRVYGSTTGNLTTAAEWATGTTGDDEFLVNAGALGTGDEIAGLAGVDTVRLASAGLLDVYRPDSFTGIERLGGSSGDDTILVSQTRLAEITSIDGGAGNDRLTLGFSASYDLSGVALSNIEEVAGGDGADTIILGAGSYTVYALQGNDTITAAAGSQLFNNSEGMDTIIGFAAGGTEDSIDLRSYTSFNSFLAVLAAATQNGANVNINLGGGNGFILQNVTLGSLTDADFLLATAAPQSLLGTSSAETLNGRSGNDTINGLGGGDTIRGDSGDDLIYYYANDTFSNIFGGLGTDTLVIIGGSAPTSLNLTAQGFEQARHDQSDTGNTQAWTTIVDTYNASWQMLSSNRTNDDGSRLNTTYDRGALTWNSIVEEFNTAGQRSIQRTYNDNNSYIFYYWDPTNVQTWNNFSEEYNTAAQREVQRIYNDDGTYRFFYWDPTNAQTWSTFDDEFTAAGGRWVERLTYDNGTSRYYYWDVTNTQTWTTFDEEYTAGPAATRSVQRIQNDDGTTSQQFWDTNNSQTYSTYIDYMNAAGQRTEQRIFHDAGGYTRYFYDPTNVQTWQLRTQVYDAAGVLVSTVDTPD